jgi:hypothetical protein
MADEIMLELAVDTTDEEAVSAIEEAVAAANPKRWESTRDIGTILTLASSSVGLLNALLVLKASLGKKDRDKDKEQRGLTIVIRNAEREELRLEDVSEESVTILLGEAGT